MYTAWCPAHPPKDEGTQRDALTADGHTRAPSPEGHTGAPSPDGHTGAPCSDGHTSAPSDGNASVHSVDGHASAPYADGHPSSPSVSGQASALSAGDHDSALSVDGHVSTPSTDGHTSAPPGDGHAGSHTVKSRASRKREDAKKSGAKNKASRKKCKGHTSSTSDIHIVSDSYCYDNCVLNGKPGKDMIRCSLCMNWVHISCSGENAKYIGVWTCIHCRKLPLLLSGLKSDAVVMKSSLQDVLNNEEALREEIRNLKAENGKLKQKVNMLERNNGDLRKLIETMSDTTHDNPLPVRDQLRSSAQRINQPRVADISASNIPTSNRYAALASVAEEPVAPAPAPALPRARSETPQPATNVTVIGSSIVRGVAPLVHGGSFEATGFVYPGQTARQINAKIRHIPPSEVTVLAAGTNNIEYQPLEQCKKELSQIIDNVARKRDGKFVIMGKIPQRQDKPHLNSKIDRVNQFLAQEIDRRKKWYFIGPELNNSDYKKDGLHFNRTGTAKYALEIRHAIRSITRHHR